MSSPKKPEKSPDKPKSEDETELPLEDDEDKNRLELADLRQGTTEQITSRDSSDESDIMELVDLPLASSSKRYGYARGKTSASSGSAKFLYARKSVTKPSQKTPEKAECESSRLNPSKSENLQEITSRDFSNEPDIMEVDLPLRRTEQVISKDSSVKPGIMVPDDPPPLPPRSKSSGYVTGETSASSGSAKFLYARKSVTKPSQKTPEKAECESSRLNPSKSENLQEITSRDFSNEPDIMEVDLPLRRTEQVISKDSSVKPGIMVPDDPPPLPPRSKSSGYVTGETSASSGSAECLHIPLKSVLTPSQKTPEKEECESGRLNPSKSPDSRQKSPKSPIKEATQYMKDKFHGMKKAVKYFKSKKDHATELDEDEFLLKEENPEPSREKAVKPKKKQQSTSKDGTSGRSESYRKADSGSDTTSTSSTDLTSSEASEMKDDVKSKEVKPETPDFSSCAIDDSKSLEADNEQNVSSEVNPKSTLDTARPDKEGSAEKPSSNQQKADVDKKNESKKKSKLDKSLKDPKDEDTSSPSKKPKKE